MSVHGMKPTFTDREGYLQWRAEWRELYEVISQDKRDAKRKVQELQRLYAADGRGYQENEHFLALSKASSELRIKRVMGHKLMTILEEAKARRDRILDMHKGLAEQTASFPLSIEETRNIDFHFNKISLEFPFMPMWTLKAKGKSYYLNHIDCQAPWTTRETPENPSTKGSLRIRRGSIQIDTQGCAIIA